MEALGSVCVLILCSGAALATQGDTFQPLASYSYGYDSNISGVADATGVNYQSLGIGFNLDWKQGRQRVISAVQLNRTRYNLRYLDNDGRNASLDWQWALGNYWSGHLGGSLNRSLSFSNLLATVSNVLTNNNYDFEADYRIHPRYLLTLRRETNTYRYSAQQVSNINLDSSALGAYYLGRTLERLGVEYRMSDGLFPDRPAGVASLASSYQERRFDLIAHWALDGKTALNASIGQVHGENANATEPNYSGPEYRLDGNWAVTGKSQLGCSLYRQVSNTTYESANHANVRGSNFSYAWQILPKTSLQAGLGLQNVTFDPTPRQDKVTTTSLSATYEAWIGSELSASLLHKTGKSTIAQYNYNDDSLSLNANLRF